MDGVGFCAAEPQRHAVVAQNRRRGGDCADQHRRASLFSPSAAYRTIARLTPLHRGTSISAGATSMPPTGRPPPSRRDGLTHLVPCVMRQFLLPVGVNLPDPPPGDAPVISYLAQRLQTDAARVPGGAVSRRKPCRVTRRQSDRRRVVGVASSATRPGICNRRARVHVRMIARRRRTSRTHQPGGRNSVNQRRACSRGDARSKIQIDGTLSTRTPINNHAMATRTKQCSTSIVRHRCSCHRFSPSDPRQKIRCTIVASGINIYMR